jgi:YHS domain-containing protein
VGLVTNKTIERNRVMKTTLMLCLVAVLAVGVLAGCSPKAEETTPAAQAPPGVSSPAGTTTVSTGNPKGSVKVGDKAVCAICAVKEGTSEPEEVKEVLDYNGKTYAFCNLNEKAEFISAPAKYAK